MDKTGFIVKYVDIRFGNRPTNPEDLGRWKASRYPYLYGTTDVVFERVCNELLSFYKIIGVHPKEKGA